MRRFQRLAALSRSAMSMWETSGTPLKFTREEKALSEFHATLHPCENEEDRRAGQLTKEHQ